MIVAMVSLLWIALPGILKSTTQELSSKEKELINEFAPAIFVIAGLAFLIFILQLFTDSGPQWFDSVFSTLENVYSHMGTVYLFLGFFSAVLISTSALGSKIIKQ